jgi:hypothetical protein
VPAKSKDRQPAESQHQTAAPAWRVAPRNDVALLDRLGRDVAGTLQQVPPGTGSTRPTRDERTTARDKERVFDEMPTGAPLAGNGQLRPSSEHLSSHQGAAYLNLSPSMMAKMRCLGGGPEYLKFGRAVRYAREALDAWAHARVARNTSDAARLPPRLTSTGSRPQSMTDRAKNSVAPSQRQTVDREPFA